MLPPDQLRFLTGIFLSIPFSFIFRYIQNQHIRKYYSLILGLALEYYVYGIDVILTLLLHFFMYSLIKNVKR